MCKARSNAGGDDRGTSGEWLPLTFRGGSQLSSPLCGIPILAALRPPSMYDRIYCLALGREADTSPISTTPRQMILGFREPRARMSIEDRLLAGLKAGVDRHWRYTKELLHIKPEYLLTIAVADELTNGFDSFHGIDIQIRLEEPTKSVAFDLLSGSIGLKKWFKAVKPTISRKGKVDIFIITTLSRHAIELKGFDPSAPELKKELIRLQEFLLVNGGDNKLESCHVVFPTLIDRSQWIEKHANSTINRSILKYTVVPPLCVETCEDPDDGIPCYYANCVTLTRL
jgi:hypothetical protein